MHSVLEGTNGVNPWQSLPVLFCVPLLPLQAWKHFGQKHLHLSRRCS